MKDGKIITFALTPEHLQAASDILGFFANEHLPFATTTITAQAANLDVLELYCAAAAGTGRLLSREDIFNGMVKLAGFEGAPVDQRAAAFYFLAEPAHYATHDGANRAAATAVHLQFFNALPHA